MDALVLEPPHVKKIYPNHIIFQLFSVERFILAMEHRTDERPSDELPFLADEEKDMLTITTRPSLSQRWASLLPYSLLLNAAGVILVLAFLAEPRRDPRRANGPNEIYCTKIPTCFNQFMLT